MPRTLIVATCAALSLALAACGDDDNDSSSTPAAATTTPAATTTAAKAATTGDVVNVTMKDIKFVPAKITVHVGQKIHWTNDDAPAHNVTATKGADFASDTLNTGGTFDYTPKKVGVIQYVCTIHPGQDGTITVTK
jgi:plastocyanin